jgi:biopolymer transport protein ExbD
MKHFKQKQESHFEINLAPMLDVIVSIIPMLLMSVVFLKVNMIEAQIPQIVSQIMEQNKKGPPKTTISLMVTAKDFKFVVNNNGKKQEIAVNGTNGTYDYDHLYREALELKRKYPNIFKVEIKPQSSVPLDNIVQALDHIRKAKKEDPQFVVQDPKTGQSAQTDLMFPEVTFSDVLADSSGA